jgi:hypothetical protein
MSYRWVTFCIDRKQIVRDLKKNTLPNLLPWCHKMPMAEFQCYKVLVKGFNNHYKYVLREMTEMLGGEYVEWKDRGSLTSADKLIFLNKNPTKLKKKLKSDEILIQNQIDINSIIIKEMPWFFKTVSSGKIQL